MNSINKLAKLLRTKEGVVLDLEKKMARISGKKGVVDKIIKENDERVEEALKELFPQKKSFKAEEVFWALINKTKETDQILFNYFGYEKSAEIGARNLINATKDLAGKLTGFYLKKEKAAELLKLNPPKNIISALGYNNIDEALEKEDVFEVFCALRIAESEDWLNNVFFEPYHNLKKEDFEQREIKIMVLPDRCINIAKKFLGEKLHHMSHLKEMGIVFIIPIKKQLPGEVLYLLFMILHYTYEVDWHSRLFEKYSQTSDFAKKMIAALKVEVSSMPLPNGEKMSWRLAPKYLAKHNPDDPRLFEPHISPEAWHYTRAGKAIKKFSKDNPELGLDFWKDSDVVCEYFPSEDVLVSFDMFDNGISLLKQSNFESKYLYHQQEALWNKIFIRYLGEEALDKIMMDNLDKGFVSY